MNALNDANEHDADADGHRLLGLRLAGGAAHTAVTGVNDAGKGAATHADAERGARSPAGRHPPALDDANVHDADADGHQLLGLRLAGGAAHTAATLTFKYEKGTATNIAAARGARGPDVHLLPSLFSTDYKTKLTDNLLRRGAQLVATRTQRSQTTTTTPAAWQTTSHRVVGIPIERCDYT